MPEPKRSLKVFLCHARADRDAVRRLFTRLTQDGVDVWLDKDKLLPGQDWKLEIRKAVREADVVVVCLSKQFNLAGFRQKEVRIALDESGKKPEGEIFIIPARLEDCATLESLRKWQWVDLFEDGGHEMLMRALQVRADKIGVTSPSKKRIASEMAAKQRVDGSVSEKKTVTQKLISNGLEKTQKNLSKLNVNMKIVAMVGFAGTVIMIVVGIIIIGIITAPSVGKWLSSYKFNSLTTATVAVVPPKTSTFTSSSQVTSVSPTPFWPTSCYWQGIVHISGNGNDLYKKGAYDCVCYQYECICKELYYFSGDEPTILSQFWTSQDWVTEQADSQGGICE